MKLVIAAVSDKVDRNAVERCSGTSEISTNAFRSLKFEPQAFRNASQKRSSKSSVLDTGVKNGRASC